jgi:hypothetical protein
LSIFADFAYTAVPLTYDKKSIIERSCQAWNEILSEDGFIKKP